MPLSIDRRRFLQVSAGAALTGVAAGAGLRMPDVRLRPKPSARRVLTKEFHLGPSEFSQGSRSGLTAGTGGLELAHGRSEGHFLSPVVKSDLVFDYIGLSWSISNPDGGSAAFWVRTSPDGSRWSAWQTVQVDMPPAPLAEYDTYGALVWADRASYVQFLGELRGASEKPSLDRVGLTLLNPYDGPTLETASAPDDGDFEDSALAAEADPLMEEEVAPAAASGKPINFKREDWGADESLRFSGGEEVWPRSYVPTKKLIVHHTATGNGYATVEDAKAVVRAVYTYHARSLGWGDIGYNCLIDKFGNSYEGRRGRSGPGYDGPGGREILSEDVVAGHALAYNYGSSGISLLGTFCSYYECSGGGSPSSAMISRLKDVLTWECRRHGLNPESASDFLLYDGTWHRGLRNVVGHRDVGLTSCPGENVYSLLPQLRTEVAGRLADSAAPTVSITSAPNQGIVKSGQVEFAWKGSGGSGGLKYSYCLEGWSRRSGTSQVNYLLGFNSRKKLAWSPWTRDTKVRFCYVAKGVYTFHVRVRDATGRVGVYEKTRSFWGTAQSEICDGVLLKGSGPKIYVMKKGLKRYVPDPTTFEVQGFLWGNVIHISNSSLKAIPSGDRLLSVLEDGNLLKGKGDAVYVMEGGRKRHVTSPAVMDACGYGWDAVWRVSNSALSAIPTGSRLSGPPGPHLSPPGGFLVQGTGGTVYVMRRGLKRRIPNPITFAVEGYRWGNVNRIADSTLASIPTGHSILNVLADGNLLKGSGSAVYVMEGGRKRHVTSSAVMDACGYGWDAVRKVPDARLSAIPAGSRLSGSPGPHLSPPGGRLVTDSGSKVYVMQKGLKRHIPNPITFAAEGYRWGNLNRLADSSLASIPMGDSILNALADGNLLKGKGGAVYVMEGGRKRHVTSPAVMDACGYGWDAVRKIPDARLSAIPEGTRLSGPPGPHLSPPDDRLVTDSGSTVYVMRRGLKRRIPNPITFAAEGYRWGNLNRLADSSLASIPTGDRILSALADGNLLKGKRGAVYVMEGGAKRHVTSPGVMDACEYGWDAVRKVPDARLSAIPEGSHLSGAPGPHLSPPDGALIQGSGDPVYVMDSGLKRLIADDDVLSGCAYQMGNVNSIADSSLEYIPVGDDLAGEPCP
jgi:hypothetical protein